MNCVSEHIVRILHTNDTHSYLDNFAKRWHVIQSTKQKYETLIFDCGDVLTGSMFFSIYRGRKEPVLLNTLGYDAMTLGNHEFDNGSRFLSKFIKKLNFPVLASNLNVEKDKYLSELEQFEPFIIKELSNGVKMGVFGLVTPTTQMSSSPSRDVVFLDPIKQATEMVANFKAQGVDVIVVLSHLGDDVDVVLAEQVSGIDVILGAHTHKVFEEPVIVGNTVITQMGSYGRYVGDIALTFQGKKLQKIEHGYIDLQEYADADETLQAEIDEWMQDIERMTEQKLATTTTELVGKRVLTREGSTNLGNLVADAFFYKAVNLGFDPELAIMNSGGIRTSIPVGDITYGQVMQTLPFACELVVATLSGQDVIDCLSTGEYPQLSHARVVYHQQENGKRVLQTVEVLENGTYQPIDPNKQYEVATNTFVASGKDNYAGFTNKKNKIKDNILDVDVFIEHIVTLAQPIQCEAEMRVVVLKEE